MSLTRESMDRKLDEHFRFEAQDDVEGVLATLAPEAEHDIVGAPTGPTLGREGARGFYVQLFSDLSDGKVRTLRRLYGDDFIVDESLWSGTAPGRPFGLEGRGRPSSSGCCTSCSSRTTATSRARTSGWTWRPSSVSCRRAERDGQADRRTPAATPADAQGSAAGRRATAAAGRAPQPRKTWQRKPMVSRATALSLLHRRRGAAHRGLARCIDARRGAPCSGLVRRRIRWLASNAWTKRCTRPCSRTSRRCAACSRTPCCAHSRAAADAATPARQNRRTPMIEAALEPARSQFTPDSASPPGAGPGAADRHRGHHRDQGRIAAGRRAMRAA